MMLAMSFRAHGIEPADGFSGDGFLVRPLVPADVELDHEAVMSSREFLYHWEQDPPYPPEDFSVEDNLQDLEQMDGEHRNGTRYTYTVMNTDQSQVLGCIYLLPNGDRMYQTAEVTSHDGTDLSWCEGRERNTVTGARSQVWPHRSRTRARWSETSGAAGASKSTTRSGSDTRR